MFFVFFPLFLLISCCFMTSWNLQTSHQMMLQAKNMKIHCSSTFGRISVFLEFGRGSQGGGIFFCRSWPSTNCTDAKRGSSISLLRPNVCTKPSWKCQFNGFRGGMGRQGGQGRGWLLANCCPRRTSGKLLLSLLVFHCWWRTHSYIGKFRRTVLGSSRAPCYQRDLC